MSIRRRMDKKDVVHIYNRMLLLLSLASVVSNIVRPHRRQPTRLPRPWDSPGKNTGVGCHFLLQCIKVKSESEVAQSCPTLSDPMDCSPPGSSIHGIFQARILVCLKTQMPSTTPNWVIQISGGGVPKYVTNSSNEFWWNRYRTNVCKALV